MIFEVMHRATGGTYYYRFVDVYTGYIWNTSTEAWAADTSWANSAIPMPEDPAGTGDYPIPAPTNQTGSGNANITVYNQAGASPANTDDVEYGVTRPYGSIFGF